MEEENGFKVYLAFWRVSSQSIFFNGLAGFYNARLEGICYLLSKSAISCLVTPTAILKTEFVTPISADEKGATSGFRVQANHSASFFFTLSGDSFGLLSLSTRLRLWSTDSLTYILISFFNGQPSGPVNSNTEGVGEISYFSPLSGRSRDTCGYSLE